MVFGLLSVYVYRSLNTYTHTPLSYESIKLIEKTNEHSSIQPPGPSIVLTRFRSVSKHNAFSLMESN